MIVTAAQSGADVVILDLEDSVPPAEKDAARDNAVRGLRELDWGHKTRAVRINGHLTEWAHIDVTDLISRAGDHVDVLVIPKVKSPRDVWWVEVLLDQLEIRFPRRSPVGLAALIEESEAVQRADEIARSSPRMRELIFGSGDLARSVGAQTWRGAAGVDIWAYPKARVLFAARAAGIDAIDGPFSGRIDDLEGYRDEALRANLAGFSGKWAIHPTQIPVANESFTPTVAQLDEARALLDAYERARSAGAGAIELNGEMIDEAHAQLARDILSRVDGM
jgi:citrate lyase subunit beta/citryl-CoA lyase